MALTRRMLREMGITDEQTDEIIKAHAETVDALKGYKAENEKLTAIAGELDTAKSTMLEYQSKYEALEREYGTYRDDISREKTVSAKRAGIAKILRDFNIPESCIEPIMRVTDFDKIELDENGTLSDEEAVRSGIEALWAGFIPKSCSFGAETASPPVNSSATGYSAEDIRRMSSKEINENFSAIKQSLRHGSSEA